jgi:hypothetical protein
MLLVNEFQKVIESITDGTQPAYSMGVAITPGNNTYGSYAQIISGANVTDDVYAIEVWFNVGYVDSAARDILVTLGFDPAGGTSYSGLGGVSGNEIQHLLASCCGSFRSVDMGPQSYYFPVYIKAGTSIGAKASVNNATVGTLNCFVRLHCRPSHPELLRVGSFVRTFGATTASSSGTAVTPGTGSEGSYVQLGSAVAEPLWYFEYGIGVNNATFNNNGHMTDIAVGDASNKKRVIANALAWSSQPEVLCRPSAGRHGHAAIGDLVYGRMQAGDNALNTGYSLCAYGVGG